LALLASVATEQADRVAADETPLRPDCIEHADAVELSSAAEAEERLVGTWIRCAQATRKFVTYEGDDIGFEFTADGRFYRIYPDHSGGLIRARGLGQEGAWRISDPYPAEFEVSPTLQLHLLGFGNFGDAITFHDDPDAIGIPHAKFHYFRWTGDDPTPGTPAGVTEGFCGHPVDPVAVESSAEVEALLTGSWMVCEPDAGSGLVQPGVVGIEFGADGQFSRWVRADDGTVVRDESQPATWEVYPFDEDEVTWGSAPEVVIASNGTEWWHVTPILLAEPPFLSFAYSGGGLVKGMPPASEGPLPGTGADRVLLIALLAGAYVLVGSVAWMLAQQQRATTTRSG
jgi:hypothetical protein